MAYFWGSQAILLLYLWWKRPVWIWWGLLSLAIALGILTKSTCLLLLGIALLVLLLNPRLTLRTRLFKAAIALLVAAAVNANVVAQRLSEGRWIFCGRTNWTWF